MENKKRFAFFTIMFFAAVFVFAGGGSETIKLEGNETSGDTWDCTSIFPEGVVNLTSGKYRMILPLPGMGGNYKFKFKAVAEGESLVVFTHFFRGKPMGTMAYTAKVDSKKKLTMSLLKYPDVAHAPNEVFDFVPLDTGIIFSLEGDKEIAIADLPEVAAEEILETQAYLPGTWYFEENQLYYTFTNDRLMLFNETDGNGITLQIDKWQYITNQGENRDDYPSGFRVSGTLAEKAGNWYIGPTNTDVMDLYLSNDKSSFVIGENVFIKVDASSFTFAIGYSYDIVDGETVTITRYSGSATTADIPDRIKGLPVTAIDDHTFYNHRTVTNVNIPLSVSSLGNSAFTGRGNITNINVDALNPYYASVDGVLFSKDLQTIVKYPDGKAEKSYTIPSSVRYIGSYAFYQSKLTSIIIPSSVTVIGYSAFTASSLSDINIPSSVTEIGVYAFSRCKNLASITIPSSVTVIGYSAFTESGLTSITFPSSITIIGSGMFHNCNSLVDVTIPSSVTSIKEMAFNGCWKITSITIPSSVTDIARSAFSGCWNLASVSLSRHTEIGKDAFPSTTKLNYVD